LTGLTHPASSDVTVVIGGGHSVTGHWSVSSLRRPVLRRRTRRGWFVLLTAMLTTDAPQMDVDGSMMMTNDDVVG